MSGGLSGSQRANRNSSGDDCVLLEPDESLDSPIENGNLRHCLYRQRSSISQVPSLSRLQSSISVSSLSADMPHLEERMRRRLQYFFMNPCQKYQAKRRKPYKLGLQLLKIALVTIQLCLFGQSNLNMVHFKQKNDMILRATFLRSNTTYYTKSAIYHQINHIRQEYANWGNNTVGMLMYPNGRKTAPAINMTVQYYPTVEGANQRILPFDPEGETEENTYVLKQWSNNNPNVSVDCVELRNGTCIKFDFMTLKLIDLQFEFYLIQVVVPVGFNSPSCFNTSIRIIFDNSAHNGELSPVIKSQYKMKDCDGDDDADITGMKIFLNFFDSFIISICSLSMVLCIRSIWKAQILRKKFELFFRAQYNKNLKFSEKMEFFNMWYLLIIISDVLTILGSLSKLVLQNQYEGIVDYNICSIFLGVGCLCVWIGVLRYAGFFHKYNILVLTLKKSLPNVCRFMVCASLLYLGFMFCGWAMLGPHHHKFRSLVVTSEALYSLINGDDMYMTYEEMSRDNLVMVVISQIYLYVFISLFIYVVLSLFIAVIMDTYETIKEIQEGDGPQLNEIEKFLSMCSADASVDNYRFELNSPTHCYCCFGNDEDFYSDGD